MDIRVQRLNEAFSASGLTQAELCKKTGITKGAMSSYLSGRYFPKQRAIEALADALNVSIPYLMGYDEMVISEDGVQTDYLSDGVLIEKVKKLYEGRPNILDLITNGQIDLIINSPAGKESVNDDSYLRKNAIKAHVPYITTVAAARAAVEGIHQIKTRGSGELKSLQEWHAEIHTS